MPFYLTSTILIILGILSWSFTEYMLHRFLGHELKMKVRFKKEHLKHHHLKDYYASTSLKAMVSIVVISILFLLTQHFLGSMNAILFSGSFTLTYLLYEFIHKDLHIREPKTELGRKLRAHHLYHHQVDDHSNYGVTSTLWDYVFNTKKSDGLP